MPSWLLYALIAMLLWGTWGFLPKLATRTLDTQTTLFFQQLGAMCVGVLVLVAARFRLKIEPVGISWAVLTGMLGVCGLLCYLKAITHFETRDRLSLVVMLTAMNPIITVLLSVAVGRERITGQQWIGILLALSALVLMVKPSK